MWLSQLGEEAGVALRPSTREFTCIDVIRVWIAVFQRDSLSSTGQWCRKAGAFRRLSKVMA
jgi:hypothetical protein